MKIVTGIIGALAAMIGMHLTPANRHLIPTYLDHPCGYEDSINCYWDAGAEGNHRGHSFFAVEMHDGMGTVCRIYIAKQDQHWNDCS